MDKEDLRKIIKKEVEDVWFNRRSIDPVKDQTDTLTERMWNVFRNIERERNFYELALRLEEGNLTEEEYNQEIEENPEKYVVDYKERS